jgi:hypothetical protein
MWEVWIVVLASKSAAQRNTKARRCLSKRRQSTYRQAPRLTFSNLCITAKRGRMETNWELVRDVSSAAIDSCGALERAGYDERSLGTSVRASVYPGKRDTHHFAVTLPQTPSTSTSATSSEKVMRRPSISTRLSCSGSRSAFGTPCFISTRAQPTQSPSVAIVGSFADASVSTVLCPSWNLFGKHSDSAKN